MKPLCKAYLLDDGGERFFGPGPAALLERVDALGSLHAAAGETGLSYTKALRMVRDAERALGEKLLVTETGGSRGGGSTLTPAARRLLSAFRAYEAGVKRSAEELFRDNFNI